MKFFIIHFASSLLRILLSKILLPEILYGVLLVLSRCSFHHLVENSILYKKDLQHLCIGPILFSENKIIRLVVSGKVDGQILFGARSEKLKIVFDARDENWKNLLVPNDSYEKFIWQSKGQAHNFSYNFHLTNKKKIHKQIFIDSNNCMTTEFT